MEINVCGPFLFANTVLPGMLARGRGRIINLASGAGLWAAATASAYCVSKAALIRLTENIALETRNQGIATFAIHPGTVRTPMNEHFMQSEAIRRASPEIAASFDQLFAEGRDTPIERSVQLVLALASGRADALSGCFLAVEDDLDALIARTNSGRNRLNILGAYSPDDRSLISLEGRESCDAGRVVQLLHKLRAANPGKRLLVVLDNASYHHAPAVKRAAAALRIQLLYLPPYSPNLNLIEERPTDYTWRPRQPQHPQPNLPSMPSFDGSDRRRGSA